ncbi:MAG: hypothetical protein ACTSRA_21300, partial [Promethearchaeota archaeon]
DTEIGDGVKLKESVLFENCFIDNFVSIEHVIISDGVKAGRWVKIEGPGLFGSNVSIEENVSLIAKGDTPIRACPWKNIRKADVEIRRNGNNELFFL